MAHVTVEMLVRHIYVRCWSCVVSSFVASMPGSTMGSGNSADNAECAAECTPLWHTTRQHLQHSVGRRIAPLQV